MTSEETPSLSAKDELAAAVSAFDRGDYASARLRAARAEQSDDEDTRTAAADLRRRLQTPPLTRTILVLTGLLLVVITLFAYGR